MGKTLMRDPDAYRVHPGRPIHLNDVDPNDTAVFDGDKDEGREYADWLSERLDELQDQFYADRRHALLIVLQGMDTSGKDGTIRRVFQSVDPLGVRVKCFVRPTPEELAHDFLWRVHPHVPARGEIAIFNRSHYEDVVTTRVLGTVDEAVCRARCEHINGFERSLADHGTVILKFLLHIDREEQGSRLQARLDAPHKHWKFDPADLEARLRWPAYMQAYGDALAATSTEWAPWFIVPANRKWYRDLVVGAVIVRALESLDLRYPTPDFDPAAIVIP